MVDSYHSRRFPTFHLKNRRTFTLFTSWDEQEQGLVITTPTDRRVLTSGSGAQLLDYLQSIQQKLYTAERIGDLPTWVQPQLPEYASGSIVIEEEQQPAQIVGPGRLLLPSRKQEQ